MFSKNFKPQLEAFKTDLLLLKGKKNKEIYRLGICNLMWGALERGEEPDPLVILYKDLARSFDQKLVFLLLSGI